MLNQQVHDLLQQFVTLPDPTHAQIFEAQAERDELADEVESLKSDNEGLMDDLKDSERDKDDLNARGADLEAALADALSWIAETLGGQDKAEGNKEFVRLYKVL
jgi:chromosome segregation ATPase